MPRATGDPVDFAVPSGNFGNILAGHVARRMGLPIRRLMLATNENDVLDEFFRTGRYRVRGGPRRTPRRSRRWTSRRRRTSSATSTISSGATRPSSATSGRHVERDGGFDLSATPYWPRVAASGFVSGRSTHADRIATIRDVHARDGVVVDPHTADGVKVARERREPGVPMVCIETALPAKFAATIREALGRDPNRPAGFADLESRPQRSTRMPADVDRIKAYIAAHAAV